jgi:zinc transporter
MEADRVRDPGDLVAAFARAISTQLDPEVAALGDTLDDCESGLDPSQIYKLRTKIAEIRSDAITYRRFVAPDRDALVTLAHLDFDWLEEEDRLHIREACGPLRAHDRGTRGRARARGSAPRADYRHARRTDGVAFALSLGDGLHLPAADLHHRPARHERRRHPLCEQAWAFLGRGRRLRPYRLVVLVYFARIHWLRRQ